MNEKKQFLFACLIVITLTVFQSINSYRLALPLVQYSNLKILKTLFPLGMFFILVGVFINWILLTFLFYFTSDFIGSMDETLLWKNVLTIVGMSFFWLIASNIIVFILSFNFLRELNTGFENGNITLENVRQLATYRTFLNINSVAEILSSLTASFFIIKEKSISRFTKIAYPIIITLLIFFAKHYMGKLFHF